MDKPIPFGGKTHRDQGFANPTYNGPADAFLASAMANQGLPWPRKPLSGKPAMTKGHGGPRGGKSGRGGRSVRLRRAY